MRESCVTSTPAPPASQCPRRSRSTASPVTLSSAPVGSSASSRIRSPTTARAMATRCCSPPESASGNRPASSRSPSRSSVCRAFRRAVRRSTPSSSSGSETFSSAVRPSIMFSCWNTYPMRRLRRRARAATPTDARSTPSTRTRPEVGLSSPPASPSRVVLPDPLGPMTATSSPGETASDTSVSAATRRCPSPWTLETSRSSRVGVIGAPPLTVGAEPPPAPGAAGRSPARPRFVRAGRRPDAPRTCRATGCALPSGR